MPAGEVVIDTETLKALIAASVAEGVRPLAEKISTLDTKVAVLETISQIDQRTCPKDCPCHEKLEDISTKSTEAMQSSKSAHHRLNDNKRATIGWAGAVGGSIAGAVELLKFAMGAFK